MYELRVKLPYLSNENPDISRLKKELVQTVLKQNQIPSYAMSSDPTSVELVELADPPTSEHNEQDVR